MQEPSAGLAAIFSAACLRYPLSFFDRQGTSRASQHALSQLMIFSPKLRRLYGMISPTERAYLYWYGRHIFSWQGRHSGSRLLVGKYDHFTRDGAREQ